jgi:hypothetical protein
MKKLILGIFLIAGIAAVSSCQKDRCPAHGQINQPEQVHRV